LPNPLLHAGFCNSVASEAVLYLISDMPPLDDTERVRHKILFACGTLYDFIAGTSRRGERSDRVCRHLPWNYAPTPVLDASIAGLVAKLETFHKDGGTIVTGIDTDAARSICRETRELATRDPFLKFMLSWCVDVDEVFLWIKWLTRGGSSHPRFTEATWLVGAAQGGKDVMIGLVQAFGGTSSDGVVANLKWNYITSRRGGGVESCAPFLRSCAAARFIIVSEVPNEPISMVLLKPLCEQRGAMIAARNLYEGSHGFRPMALPLITSNFTPKLCDDEASDSGAKSRIRVYSTSAIYNLEQTELTHRAADVDLADQVNAGAFNSSLFAFMKGFYQLLAQSSEARNIGPLPERVREETNACFHVSVASRFELWWGGRSAWIVIYNFHILPYTTTTWHAPPSGWIPQSSQ
jgi:hypothetical protein